MYQTYWIRACLQVILIYFLIDDNINCLFQTERRTSARGSLMAYLEEKRHCINAVNLHQKCKKV